MKYSKFNFVYIIQKWMDSVQGQTFLNYAYSWGAAIVILGTLFKLTHLPGADLMLFLGMGTEVFVFFISAFDRPFDKTTQDMPLSHYENGVFREDPLPGGNKEMTDKLEQVKSAYDQQIKNINDGTQSVTEMNHQTSILIKQMKILSSAFTNMMDSIKNIK